MSLPWSAKGSKGTIADNDEFMILDFTDSNPATKNKRVAFSVVDLNNAKLNANQTFTGDNTFKGDVKVIKDSTGVNIELTTFNGVTDDGAFWDGRRSRGTESVPSAVISGDSLTSIGGFGYDGTSFELGGFQEFITNGNWTPTSHPTQYRVFTTPVGSTAFANRFTIAEDGTMSTKGNNVVDVGFIDSDEITPPGNPAANVGRLYVADDSSVTTLFFRDSVGSVTNLLAGGGSGDVVGPASSTDNGLARFDGTTGKLVQNSNVLLSDIDDMTFPTGGRITQTPGTPKIVGSVTGGGINQPRAVYVSGKLAYVAATQSGTLSIIDVSKPSAPVLIGTLADLPNLTGARGVFVVGNYAYLASITSDTFAIIDVSIPSNPTLVSTLSDTVNMDNPYDVYVAGNFAYVAGNQSKSLAIVDISNPKIPKIVGSVIDPGTTQLDNPTAVRVLGNYAYVTATASDALTVIDVSDPTNPKIVGSVTNTLLDVAIDLQVIGRYAYVVTASATLGRLVTVDIKDPTNPTITGNVQDPLLNGASSIHVSGNYAYVAAINSNALVVVDISTPTAPVIVTSLVDAVNLSAAIGVYVAGKYAYVTPRITNSLEVIDITGIESPSASIGNIEVGSLTVDSNADIGNNLYAGGLNVGLHGIHSDGGVTLAGDHLIQNASTNPSLAGFLDDATFNGVDGVFVEGNYAYVVSEMDDRFQIVDITDPAKPFVVGEKQDAINLNGIVDVSVAGKYAYVTCQNDDSLRVIDISNKSDPQIVGTGVKDDDLDNIIGIHVVGKYAYVACRMDNSLRIIDITNPLAPVIVGGVKEDIDLFEIIGVAVAGRYAYVPSPVKKSLQIIDISDPTAPFIEGSIVDDSLSGAIHVAVEGRYAYVACEIDNSVRIIDISNPDVPVIVGGIKDDTNLDSARHIKVAGRYAYVVCFGDNSLRIIDISDPTKPVLVAGIKDDLKLLGAIGIDIAGRYAYVTCFTGDRFQIIDLNSMEVPAANIGTLNTTSLHVSDNARIANTLTAQALNVGSNGIRSDGPVSSAERPIGSVPNNNKEIFKITDFPAPDAGVITLESGFLIYDAISTANRFDTPVAAQATGTVTTVSVMPEVKSSATIDCVSVAFGDTVTINGLVYTAVNGLPVNPGDFDVAGVDDQDALALRNAITIDTRVGNLSDVTASVSVNQVTVTQTVAGIVGNTTTLVSSAATRLIVSGATFTGGIDGDTLRVNGLVYTAVSGTKADDTQFSVDTGDNATATDLADSITNDTRTGIDEPTVDQTAIAAINVVTITASVVSGIGNNVGLISSDATSLAVSGATLTGGGIGIILITGTSQAINALTYTGGDTFFTAPQNVVFEMKDMAITLSGNNAQIFDITENNTTLRTSNFLMTGTTPTIGTITNSIESFIRDVRFTNYEIGLSTVNGNGVVIEDTIFRSNELGTNASLNITKQMTGIVNVDTSAFITSENESAFFLDPQILGIASIKDCVVVRGQPYKTAPTGTFSAASDEAATNAISSVSDNGGVAVFDKGSALTNILDGDIVIHTAFTSYNGTFEIFASTANTYQVRNPVTKVAFPFGPTETGTGTTELTRFTSTAHGLASGNPVIVTSTAYDNVGSAIRGTPLTNSFDLKIPFNIIDTGVWQVDLFPFTVAADLSVTNTITSVEAVAGGTRFVATPISGLTDNDVVTHTTFTVGRYNGVFVITNVQANSYDVLRQTAQFTVTDGGTSTSNLTRFTSIDHTLIVGQGVQVKSSLYSAGGRIQATTVGTVDVTVVFNGTDTGSLNINSLDQTDPRITVLNTTGSANSMITGELHLEAVSGPVAVTINTQDVPVIIGTTTWTFDSLERTLATNAGVMTFTGLTETAILVNFSALVEKVGGGATEIGVGLFKNGVAIANFVYPRSVNTGVVQVSASRTIRMNTNDTLEMSVINFGNTDNIEVSQADLIISESL